MPPATATMIPASSVMPNTRQKLPAHQPPGPGQGPAGALVLQHDDGGDQAEHGREPDGEHQGHEDAEHADDRVHRRRRAGQRTAIAQDEAERSAAARARPAGPAGWPAAGWAAAARVTRQASAALICWPLTSRAMIGASSPARMACTMMVSSTRQPERRQRRRRRSGPPGAWPGRVLRPEVAGQAAQVEQASGDPSGDDRRDRHDHGGEAQDGLGVAADGGERAVEDLAHARAGGAGSPRAWGRPRHSAGPGPGGGWPVSRRPAAGRTVARLAGARTARIPAARSLAGRSRAGRARLAARGCPAPVAGGAWAAPRPYPPPGGNHGCGGWAGPSPGASDDGLSVMVLPRGAPPRPQNRSPGCRAGLAPPASRWRPYSHEAGDVMKSRPAERRPRARWTARARRRAARGQPGRWPGADSAHERAHAAWLDADRRDQASRCSTRPGCPPRRRSSPATNVAELVDAIRRLVIRGAPVLGVAGAFGVALAAYRGDDVAAAARLLGEARPTAVNLAWGTRRALAAYQAALGRAAEPNHQNARSATTGGWCRPRRGAGYRG